MKSNLFILHSLNADTVEFWGADIKERMETKGVQVFMPLFPIRAESSFEKFDEILSKFLQSGELNSNSVIVAHSIGNPYFIRFAAKHNFVPRAYIAVAPGAVYEYPEVRTDYIVAVKRKARLKAEELEFIKKNVKGVKLLYSDEDDKNLEKFTRFAADTGAESFYLTGYSHFDGRHRIYRIPELVEMLEDYFN